MISVTCGPFGPAGRELVAEGADLCVQVLSLAAGQCVPWHYHSEVSDSFVCLEGPMVVETRAPRRVYRLLPGERCGQSHSRSLRSARASAWGLIAGRLGVGDRIAALGDQLLDQHDRGR
jgi:hypothetical protein